MPKINSKLSILVAHFRPDIVSGAEFAIGDMVKKCPKNFRFIMLTPGAGNLGDYYQSHDFEIWPKRIETTRRKYPGLHTLQSYLFARQLQAKGIDAVIANTFPAASRVQTACRFAGIPYAIYVREYISDKPLHRAIPARADKIFAVSGDVAAYLSPMVDPGKIVPVHDHLHAEPLIDRLETRGPKCFAGDQPVVGIIGRITSYKQQDLFVRAIPWVAKAVPEARFVIVGNASERERAYEGELRRLASKLQVEDRLAFLGHRTDALEIMTELTVCCLTSDREPFPRTVLEAQLAGCAVIASDTGGCPEMIEGGVTGLLFPSTRPDSHERLAEKIIRLLGDDALRQRLAINAKEKLMQTFASDMPVRQFEAHLRSLIR